MNLKKLFNYKYLFQNVKKSAQLLSIFVGLVPILNTIFLILKATSTSGGYLASLEDISAFTIIGMYILPYILVACLFDFMFKKRSVDFIGSMPISKKSIFVTNMIGGGMIIVVMLLISTILMGMTSLIFPNIYLPFGMLVDYFLIFLVGYLFVYSATALAFSVTGNMITGFVVTLLLLFFVPFLRSYTSLYLESKDETYIQCESEACIPQTYDYNNAYLKHTLYHEYYFDVSNIRYDTIYTLPYSIIGNGIGFINTSDGAIEYNGIQLLVTFGMTLVYGIIGFYAFSKRKLEVSETSFANMNVHLFVKFLTMFPICLLAYIVIKNASIYLILFIFVLLLVYYFVYDLITKKTIDHIKKSIISFILSVMIIWVYGYILDVSNENSKTIILKEKEITKIEVSGNYFDFLNTNYYEVTDSDTIAYLLSLLTEPQDGDSYYLASLKMYVNGNIYEANLLSHEEDNTAFFEKLNRVSSVENTNILNSVYAIETNDQLANKTQKKDILNDIKQNIDNKISQTCPIASHITLYEYKNHQVVTTIVSTCLSSSLQEKVALLANKKVAEKIDNLVYLTYEDAPLDFPYFVDNDTYEIYQFILNHLDDPIDIDKDILILYTSYGNGYTPFYTNAKEEFETLVSSLREKAKDTDEYQQYMASLDGETDEY